MTDYDRLVDHYVAMWNKADAGNRKRLIAALWSEDCIHTNKRAEWHGHAAMLERVTGSYEKSIRDGGHRFEAMGNTEGYRNVVRLNWHMRPAGGGKIVAQGFELLVLADDGRIKADYQFIDPTPNP